MPLEEDKHVLWNDNKKGYRAHQKAYINRQFEEHTGIKWIKTPEYVKGLQEQMQSK